MNQFSTGGVFGNTAKRLTASELAQALNDQLDDVPGRLGLTEIHFSPDEIRCGPNGHISIVRRAGQGKQRGWWMDFKADADGTDMLDFSAHILGSSISDTMRWAASSFTLVPAARYEHPVPQDENAAQKALAKKIAAAIRVWKETLPIAGTVGEVYLRETRGITAPIGPALRFHPHLYHRSAADVVSYWPAIVGAVTIAPHDHISGVWRIYLSKDGKKAPVDKAKKGLGATFGHGGAVRLTKASSHLFIAEGIENGLSALSLRPGTSIWCAMAVAGFASMSIPANVERITILADNDVPGSRAHRALMDGAKTLAQTLSPRNITVGLVRPPAEYKDLNALLLGGGA